MKGGKELEAEAWLFRVRVLSSLQQRLGPPFYNSLPTYRNHIALHLETSRRKDRAP